MRILLQNLIEGLPFENLPPNWNSFDFECFSNRKKLWDYQQEACKNALKVLWRYFEDALDYEKNEKVEDGQKRKSEFYRWYRDNGLDEDLSIKSESTRTGAHSLLAEYYHQNKGAISYENFTNRMCFWMATGSGKSLVIVKLVQVLKDLIELGEIPPYDILVLTYRDDLIEQLKSHVDEFNYGNNEIHINLKELRDYPALKRQRSLLAERDITVFYYRSDNLSDEQKEKIIDFRNYDDNGKWYIILDEAHKGDREESKRQHIYSILSRNGFLFNFSATFVDQRDIMTTAFNFNLERFINSGYGKHIAILKQEIRAFQDDEDYSGDEKQKIVLKSLILLTYARKFYEQILQTKKLYHSPLLLTLVNSVNTEDADLELFFREIEKIGNGEVRGEVFASALEELWTELKNGLSYTFEDGNNLKVDEGIFKRISQMDILKHVYNSERSGQIEVLMRPSDRKEIAFKLKTSDRPFALIKIGDISNWLKEKLAGYEVQQRFEDESYFENLNRENSEINVLMGSRTFYEGWDSNRPNVINYVNIGTGEDAKKFILQSVGRGIRIEPVKEMRKRLLPLYNSRVIDDSLFDQIKDKVQPLETLVVFGTNRAALSFVIKELDKQRKREDETLVSLYVNEDVKNLRLLVPTFEDADHPLLKEGQQIKFGISQGDFETLKSFIEYVQDDRVMLMKYDTDSSKTRLLRQSIQTKDSFKQEQRNFRNLDLLIQRIFDYYSVVPKRFKDFKDLEDEINHFRRIKVYLKDITEIQRKIDNVKEYPSHAKTLQEQYGKLSPSEYIELAKNLKNVDEFESDHQKIRIKYVANHYYVPIIMSQDEKVGYISHIVKTPSEVRFINDLETYVGWKSNQFKKFDWWFFSKLDESLDEIYLPYYNPNLNKISGFYPDFIFWLKKDENLLILFVDPKGVQHIDWTYKIEGYKWLFEKSEKTTVLGHDGMKVTVKLLMRTDDTSRIPDPFKPYWFDNIEKIFEHLDI